MRRKEAGFIAAQAAIFVGVLVLVSLPVQSTNEQQASKSSTVSKDPIPWQPPTPPLILVLHAPEYVDRALNRTLVLPNATILGPSFRIIGVRIDGGPNFVANHTSEVAATIYVWNGTFTNGSTTVQGVLNGKGIAIVESPIAPGGPDSAAAAQAMIALQESCVSKDGVASCTTDSTTNSDYIVTQNGLSIVVNPSGSQLTWVDDKRLVYVNIVGALRTIQDVLLVAGSMTG
jgi:hypothetical protein